MLIEDFLHRQGDDDFVAALEDKLVIFKVDGLALKWYGLALQDERLILKATGLTLK